MSNQVINRRGFIAMVLAAGAAGVVGFQTAQAKSVRSKAPSAHGMRTGTMHAGGNGGHHYEPAMESYWTRPTHKDSGPIGKRRPNRPCAPLPGRPGCR